MIVKELIKRLQKLDPNLRVLSPIDDEGNGYRWPERVDDDAYLTPEDVKEYRPEQVFSEQDENYLKEECEMELSDLVRVAFVG